MIFENKMNGIEWKMETLYLLEKEKKKHNM